VIVFLIVLEDVNNVLCLLFIEFFLVIDVPPEVKKCCKLIGLPGKFPDLTGKVAEKALVAADITVNKNMVPFDSRSAFQTSGIRVGTPAITTRGVKEDKMEYIVSLIDRVLSAPEDEAVIAAVRKEVNEMMANYPIFAW